VYVLVNRRQRHCRKGKKEKCNKSGEGGGILRGEGIIRKKKKRRRRRRKRGVED
jgi:hypothetical protein